MDFSNEAQLRLAVMEDALIDFVYKEMENFVLHGGTAVWRCYKGNRFSRYLDFYTNMKPEAESGLQKKVHKMLKEHGYSIREEKYNNRTNTLHIIVRNESTTGKLDLTFAFAEGIAADYERVDGAKRIIYALNPEELMNEKINTYLEKSKEGNAEIQDLYDINILKNAIPYPDKETIKRLRNLISIVGRTPPVNEKEIGKLILNGVSPSFEDIIRMLKAWLIDIAK
jgi:predicted nucleotidyltransferase component of viral defense system